MLRFTPSDNVEVLLRYEHGEANGDGPATQNHALYSRDSHDFLVNDRGFFHNKWDSLTGEINVDVGFGDEGTITNIAGRSEEHTSELQSLMRISYAVFCLKKKQNKSLQTHKHVNPVHTIYKHNKTKIQ